MNFRYSLVRKDLMAERKQMLKQWARDVQHNVTEIELLSGALKLKEKETDGEHRLDNILICCSELNRLVDEIFTSIEAYY